MKKLLKNIINILYNAISNVATVIGIIFCILSLGFVSDRVLFGGSEIVELSFIYFFRIFVIGLFICIGGSLIIMLLGNETGDDR